MGSFGRPTSKSHAAATRYGNPHHVDGPVGLTRPSSHGGSMLAPTAYVINGDDNSVTPSIWPPTRRGHPSPEVA